MVKVVTQRSPFCPRIQDVTDVTAGQLLYLDLSVSGKPRSRGEGLRSLAISNGANGVYRHSTAVVVVVFGSYVSDEP